MKRIDLLLLIVRLLRSFFLGAALGLLIGTLITFFSAFAFSDDKLAIYMAVDKYARIYNLDPDVILAVIQVESQFNPYKRGDHGEVGVMQLMPAYFPDGAVKDVVTNIKYGAAFLAFVRINCPSQKDLTWVTCFNTGVSRKPKYPHRLPYYRKIMAEYRRLKHEANKVN